MVISKLESLSDAERKGLESLNGGNRPPKGNKGVPKARSSRNGVKSEFSVESEKETVPRSKYELEIKTLNDTIDDLKGKNSELREEIKKEKESADSLSRAKSAAEKKYSDLKTEFDTLAKNNKDRETEILELKKELRECSKPQTPAIDDVDLAKLRRDLKESEKNLEELKTSVEKANGKNSELEKTLAGTVEAMKALETEKDEADAELADAAATIEDLKKRIAESADHPATTKADDHTITRTSASEFHSESFRDGMYRVILAKNGSTLVFRPDVTGTAVCIGKSISLPMLSKYVPFTSQKSFVAIGNDDGTMTISL